MNRCRFIEAQHAHYPIRLLCHVLDVPASGFTRGRPGTSTDRG